MEVAKETINSASSSRFARLSVDSRQGGEDVVVCKKSFFAWAVHAVRYRFSKRYRSREHKLRGKILMGLLIEHNSFNLRGGDCLPVDVPYGNRRGFNAYLIDHLNKGNDDSAESFTDSSQSETLGAEGVTTPENYGVQSAPDGKGVSGAVENTSASSQSEILAVEGATTPKNYGVQPTPDGKGVSGAVEENTSASSQSEILAAEGATTPKNYGVQPTPDGKGVSGAVEENTSASSQSEILAAEGATTPKNYGVQPTPEVKTKKVAGGKQSWPEEDVYKSFWEEQGPDIARDGCGNVFQLEATGQLVNKEQLLLKVSVEIFFTLGKGGRNVSNIENCALGHILFTTPRDEPKGLFRESAPIKNEDYADWGFSNNSEKKSPPARCRLPIGKLYGAVRLLLERNFKAGSSKEEILEGLDQDRARAKEYDFRVEFQDSVTGSTPSEAQFIFCVDAMKNFANAYFDANP